MLHKFIFLTSMKKNKVISKENLKKKMDILNT